MTEKFPIFAASKGSRSVRSAIQLRWAIGIAASLSMLSIAWVDSASAEDSKPPAPDYYLEYLAASTAVDIYAHNCPELSLNMDAITAAIEDLSDKLRADGFQTDRPFENFTFPPVEERNAPILSIIARHESAEDPAASFCEEARAEMARGSLLGTFLKEQDP